VQLTDVWALARRPRVALRSLLDPDDLARLGSALRTRTTNLFDGIFEPAPPPPRAPGTAAAPGASSGDPPATSRPAAEDSSASAQPAPGDPPAGSRIDV
jgi:hypothetical protein